MSHLSPGKCDHVLGERIWCKYKQLRRDLYDNYSSMIESQVRIWIWIYIPQWTINVITNPCLTINHICPRGLRDLLIDVRCDGFKKENVPSNSSQAPSNYHVDVIKWKHFPRYCPFVRGIHRSPVNSPHKGQWRGTLMFSLICARTNCWVNNREVGDLRHHRSHYDVIVVQWPMHKLINNIGRYSLT